MPRHAHGARWQHLGRRHVHAVLNAVQQEPTLHRRDKCEKDSTDDACALPAGAASALPIVLGSLIPIAVALVVLFYLHRRHIKKLRQEDVMDKTKSMDFGLGLPTQRRNPGEKSDSRARRQMSLDMGNNSPYLMPNVAPDSRESFNSLARTHTIDDRYGRPATSGNGASPPRTRHSDDDSMYASSRRFDDDGSQHSMKSGILSRASPMPTSTPPPPRNASLEQQMGMQQPHPQIVTPPAAYSPSRSPPNGPRNDARSPSPEAGLPSVLVSGRAAPPIVVQPTPQNPATQQPKFNDSDVPYMPEVDSGPSFRFSVASEDEPTPEPVETSRKSLAPGAFDSRRLSMGFRPLPPEGKADDTAEERAMRIRSFYKEYFAVEESNPPPMPTGPGAFYGNEQEYNQQYGASAYDHENGGFIIPGAKPFAEGPQRRAMTPPPRMPPRFQGHDMEGPGPRSGSAAGGRFMPPQPRSYSSASGALGPPRQPPNQRKRPIEPPKPLAMLPTPHMLGEDAFASPIMFAPHVRGEQESLRGGSRPYSPSVAAFNPLVSSFDDMALLPTPHMLRKSGTFTALDFAPPKKFKNDDGGGSDAGSIRSNRSGASAMQVHNIRNGAYRVSRIPTDVVPMKMDLAAELKPSWDVRHKV